MKNRIWSLLLVSFIASSARAATISVVGVGDFSAPSVSNFQPSTVYSANLGLGVGAGRFCFDQKMTFQLGTLLLTRNFTASNNVNFMTTNLEIAPLVRYYFTPYASVGVGPYAAIGVGPIGGDTSGGYNTTTGTFNNPSFSGNGSYSDYQISPLDIGLIGSIAVNYRIAYATTLLLDLRYSFGLTNVALNSPASFTYNDLQFLLGFRFYLAKPMPVVATSH